MTLHPLVGYLKSTYNGEQTVNLGNIILVLITFGTLHSRQVHCYLWANSCKPITLGMLIDN